MSGSLLMNGRDIIWRDGAVSPYQLLSITSGGAFNTQIRKVADSKTFFNVGRDSESNASSPSTIQFVANGGTALNLEGINTIQMETSSGKKFNITVSEDGTLTTTEVTA